jgi:hypothetical protein
VGVLPGYDQDKDSIHAGAAKKENTGFVGEIAVAGNKQ